MRQNQSTSASRRRNRISAAVFACALALVMVLPANSCPFCSAVALTFTEQIDSSDLVVIASLESEPEGADQTQLPRAIFKINYVLKGEEIMKTDEEFKAVVVSRKIKIGDQFLVMGNGSSAINWTTPQLVSDEVVSYLKKLDGLAEKGGDRLEFFAGYFEHEESMLAYDAYDEFARAPYDDVKELRGRIDPKQLIGWLEDSEVMRSRKRLYYTLLGVVGGENELAFLEEIITSGDRDKQSGLDALIACYLTLRGDEGVALIEETFLKNPEAEYIDVFSTISALRFHGAESDRVSKPRIVEALRYVLDRPKMADMVIPDLARWEDWSVVDRLVQMFKDSNTDDTRWVRTPIISYLQACPLEEAKAHIAELREIDPTAAKRADMLAELDWGDDDDEDEDEDEDEEEEGDDSDKPDTSEGQTEAGEKKRSDKSGKNESGDQKSDDDNLVRHSDSEAVADIYDDAPGQMPEAQRKDSNQDASMYVSTEEVSVQRVGESSQARGLSDSGNEQLAQRTNPAPPAAMIVPTSPSTPIMLLAGLGVCAIIFLLLWSVLNGTFERLIS